jgi:NAD-dependent SIR2 family protein deacetylase
MKIKKFYTKKCIQCGKEFTFKTLGYFIRNNIIPKRDKCELCLHIENNSILKNIAKDFTL